MTAVVPALTAPRRARRPALAERTLRSGLRVVAVRKPGAPIAELRLRIPSLSARPTHPARVALLSDTLLTGAGDLDRSAIASAVQELGADLSVSVDADRLLVSGNVLAPNLAALLRVLATVLTAAAYPAAEVSTERDRLVEKLTIARSRPGVVAGEALARRMWGEHPYALELPQPSAVASSSPAAVRRLHGELVRPGGATLVVVGDVSPARVLDQVESALSGWTGAAVSSRVPALPAPPGGPLLVVDRPGSVQSSLRIARAGLPRGDERYPALQLANLIFGGYFCSRWVENLREDKGYTYGPHSHLDHHLLGSTVALDVEVASEVTGPSWLETAYELGRIASVPVTADELDAARQYAIGSLALSTSTQAGLASTLSALAAFGLGLDWIREHPVRLSDVSVADVAEAAAEFFTPPSFTAVVVGDAATITGPLSRLTDVAT